MLPATRFLQDSLLFRLLCPQHVAQVYQDRETTCLTLMDKLIFVWGGGRWRRTLAFHKSLDVGLIWWAPGNNKKFLAFGSQILEPRIIPIDKEDEMESRYTGNQVSQLEDYEYPMETCVVIFWIRRMGNSLHIPSRK